MPKKCYQDLMNTVGTAKRVFNFEQAELTPTEERIH